MKKLLPLIVLVLVGGGIWFAVSNSTRNEAGTTASNNTGSQAQLPPTPVAATEMNSAATGSGLVPDMAAGEEEEFDEDAEIDTRLAAEIYKNADEALAAVKNGARDYDDIVLSQFTQPGDDCTWCDTFYRGIKDLLAAPDIRPEQRSYYAEILAVSGKLENVSTLTELIKNAKKPEEAQIYAEALELTIGKDDVVNYLAEQAKSKDNTLRESSIAAITNQGSRLAAEVLYKTTVESGDPDGFYSQGIGMGELVPTEEALPYLQELAQRQDQYSHLAVKAMLNAGLPGLRLVMDSLAHSKSPDAARAMLKDAIDHVNYEEDTEAYLKNLSETSKEPVVVEFAKSILSDFATQEIDDEEIIIEEEEEEAPMSKMPGT